MVVQQAPQVMLQPRRRRWPIYTTVIVVVLAALWAGYWYGAAQIANAAINRVNAAPIGGISFKCPDRTLSGFPFSIDVRCDRATISDASGLQASLAGFWASGFLFRPWAVEATLDSPLQLNAPSRGLAVTASWSHAATSGSVWLDGLNSGAASFETLAFENTGRADALPLKSLTARSADTRIAPAGNGDYRLSGNAEKVNLKLADGATIPELDIRGNAVAVGVNSLGTDPLAAFLKWAKAGASTKIEDLRLVLGGTIVTASGQLSLTKDGLLNGSILFGYNGIDALGNLLDLIRPGTKAKYADALKIVNQLTRSVDTPDGQMRQTSITFTDGQVWLTIFPLPVDPIPPIKF